MRSPLAPPIAALLLCYLIFFTGIFLTYHDLPAKVASHFDLYGNPNGWTSRDHCVEFTLGLGLLVPAFVIFMMSGAGRIPVSFVNLPHRDYWLAPDRRQAALAILLRYALWFSCLNVLFFTGLHGLIVVANLPGASHLSGIGIVVVAGGFLAGTGLWVARLLRHFSQLS